jgi:hypothetical protein
MLTGTHKQVQQAIKIRQERTDWWRVSDMKAFLTIRKRLHDEESATWWIEHKDIEIVDVLRAIAEGA